MSHVLLARLDSDGDVLLAGPAVRAAAATARVTMLVGPRGRRAAELLPGVDRLIVHRAPWIDPEPPPVSGPETVALIRRVAADLPDTAVILSSFHQSPLPLALLLRLAGVPRVTAISEDYPGSLLDVRHRVPDELHEVERSLSLMAASGMPLPAAESDALRVRRTATPVAGLVRDGYIVVHPGASVSSRAWAPRHHAALVDALAARGRPVVVTGGPEEASLTRAVAGPPRPGVFDLGGRTSLGELAEVLAGADVAVVGNTGPAHLAAAVGCPVAWLHAPTVPWTRWHPWRVPYVRIGNEPSCAGCRARECPVVGHPCIDDIGPGAVLEAIERMGAPDRIGGGLRCGS